MLCSEAITVNRNPLDGRAATLKCKRWSCPICRDDNRWTVIRAARRGKPGTFLTLTCNPHIYDCPDEAARDMVEAWVQLRRLIRRRWKVKSVPFIAVFEKTKLGWPHMHILMRAPFIPQGWISEQMRRLIGAPIVDIRALQDEGRAAAYVAKYIGKDLSPFVGCKRWWRSHDYDVGEKDEYVKVMYGEKTLVLREKLWRYRVLVVHQGYTLIDNKPGSFHFTKRKERSDGG